MVQFRIDIVVDPRGAGRGLTVIERRLKTIQDRSDRLGRTLFRVFAALGAGAAVRGLVQLADTFTLVQNKLTQVTKGTAELEAVTEELFNVANKTRSSFEATATLYQRTALATRNLGLSQKETLKFTEQLNQAIILSGATTSEAKNGLIQLSQGLALGTVQGRDLKSVMEQIPVVSDVIAKSLGITRGRVVPDTQEALVADQAASGDRIGSMEPLREGFAKEQLVVDPVSNQEPNLFLVWRATGGARPLVDRGVDRCSTDHHGRTSRCLRGQDLLCPIEQGAEHREADERASQPAHDPGATCGRYQIGEVHARSWMTGW